MSLANLVRVLSNAVGPTADLVLGSAVAGFLTPTQAGMVDGKYYTYGIEADFVTIGDDLVPTSREVGVAYYSAGTLYRSTGTITSSTNGNAALNLAGDAQVIITATTDAIRERTTALAGQALYYVRYILGAATFTGGSPNVGITGHGLSVGSAVVISILPDMLAVSVTNANPGVFTTPSNHGYAAGRPLVFSTTGYLPPGITPGTTYYVISTGLTATAFQVSTTPGGGAVNTSKQTFTAASGTGAALQITSSGNHGLVAGQIVAFSSTTTLPGGLSASTPYFVAASPAPTATVFYVSTTNGGTNVAFVNAGTGTHSIEQVGSTLSGGSGSYNYGSNTAAHFVQKTGAMPTFSTEGLLVQGTPYFVNSVVDANTVTLKNGSGTPLGNATVASGSPIYSAATGTDSAQGGGSPTRTNSFLTLQGCYDYICKTDSGGFHTWMYVADGVYNMGLGMYNTWVGGGILTIQGNNNLVGVVPQMSNCFIDQSASNSNTLFNNLIEVGVLPSGKLEVIGFKLRNTNASAGGGIALQASGTSMYTSYIEFAGCAAPFSTLMTIGAPGCNWVAAGGFIFSGNMPGWISAGYQANYQHYGQAISITNVPNFNWNGAFASNSGDLYANGVVFLGGATGVRYQVSNGASIQTGGSGASFLPGNALGNTSNQGQYL